MPENPTIKDIMNLIYDNPELNYCILNEQLLVPT